MFHSSFLVIESAFAGDGFALGDELIAGDHLLAGRLVKPFAPVHASDAAVHAVWRAASGFGARGEAFLFWLRSNPRWLCLGPNAPSSSDEFNLSDACDMIVCRAGTPVGKFQRS